MSYILRHFQLVLLLSVYKTGLQHDCVIEVNLGFFAIIRMYFESEQDGYKFDI